jgi:cellulose 1,4-beta-cellobiosidase
MELQRAAHGDSLVDLADVTAYAGGNYTDSAGLSALTEYDYALVASNAVGNSPPSSILNAWTIPTAPSGLSGTAGYAQVALSWDAESGATGYNVKRRLHGSGSYATVSGGGNVSGTSFTDTTPTAGVSYDYLVTALDAGGESSGSNVVTVTPTAPSAPTVTAVNQTHIDVAVPALAGGASSYDVQRAPDSGGSPGSWSTVQASATPSATFHDSSLSASTTYWYRLISTNSGGGTASGASRSATTLPTDTTAPAYASAQTSADGTYIDVAFTETGSPPLLPATGVTGFTVKVNGATRAIASAVRHSSLVIRLTLAEPVANFDAVKVSYNGGTGNVTDSAS